MTFEVPKDLVERVQILLRKEAGVDESYRPGDLSAPPINLPSVEEIIASFDPSPEDQRCERCKGKLLRGVESMVCVYCGREQLKEQPQPISFTSTIGYQWLLESLGLDGSETVAPVIEGLQKKRKPSSLKDEVVLSDFLNLEMEWPVGMERFGTSDTDEAEIEGKRPLHLVGVESDDSFCDSKSENLSSFPPEHAISIEQTQSKEYKTFQDKEDSSFSGWQADFQPASPNAQPNNLDSSVIPQIKDSVSGVTVSVQQSVVGALPENVAKQSIESLNPSSDVTDLSHENHLQSHGMESVTSINDMRTDSYGPEDFSDAWNDFSGSMGAQEIQRQESSVEEPDEDSSDTWDNFMSSGALFGDRNASATQMTSLGSGKFPLDAWNDFASFSSTKHNQQENSGEGPREHGTVSHTDSLGLWSDFPSSERQNDHSKFWLMQTPNDTIIKQGNDSLDLLDNIVGPAVQNASKESDNLKSAGTQDGKRDHAVDPWGDFMSLHNPSLELSGKALDEKDINNNSSPFDPWNDFGSSVMTLKDNNLAKEDIKTTADSTLKSTTQMAGSIEQPCDNKSVLEDDSFDSWSDFRSSSTAVGMRAPEAKDDLFSSWGGFGTSSVENDQLQKNLSKATADDFFNGWSSGITASGSALGNAGDSDPNLKTSKNDDSFDVWSDFTFSGNVQSQLDSRKGSTPGDGKAFQLQNVPFDSWDMLISSSSASNGRQNGTSDEHSSDPRLFGSAFDFPDSGPRSYLQPDVVMKAASVNSSSADIAASVRNDANIRELGQADAEEPPTKEKPVDDAEELFSQMPDLSFMLADSLSIPKKTK